MPLVSQKCSLELESTKNSQSPTGKMTSTHGEESELANDTFQETQTTFLDSYSQPQTDDSCSSLVEILKSCQLSEKEDVEKVVYKDELEQTDSVEEPNFSELSLEYVESYFGEEEQPEKIKRQALEASVRVS